MEEARPGGLHAPNVAGSHPPISDSKENNRIEEARPSGLHAPNVAGSHPPILDSKENNRILRGEIACCGKSCISRLGRLSRYEKPETIILRKNVV